MATISDLSQKFGCGLENTRLLIHDQDIECDLKCCSPDLEIWQATSLMKNAMRNVAQDKNSGMPLI